MTFVKIRDTRRQVQETSDRRVNLPWFRTSNEKEKSEAQERQFEEVQDVPKKADPVNEYLDALPAINNKYYRCRDCEYDIVMGEATPNQILEAARDEDSELVQRYSQAHVNEVRLCCLNHGIDPDTGKPHDRTVELLCNAIAAGMTDQEALTHSYLGAHSEIPAQMMRDKKLQARLTSARRRRRLETESRRDPTRHESDDQPSV